MSDRPDPSSRPRSAGGLLGRARHLGLRLPGLGRDLRGPDPLRPNLPRPSLSRLPLPLTSLTLLLLLLLPAVQLLRMPRPRAVGLEQLLSEASLLQSFPPTPDRPVPALWRQRLSDAQAEALWRRQRGPWWQFWGDHTDAAPLFAFSASALPGGPSAPLPANGLRVGNLVVVAADPLSRQLLRDRLLPQQRLSRGLNRRCLERLRQDQAVLWNSTGLGVITGPLAPLLQRLSRGCLSFSLAGGGLIWQGEAADSEGLLTELPTGRDGSMQALPPLPADRLLELEGGATDLLLQGLLSRPLIRDPLARRYGLDASRLSLLRRTPFRLQLRPLPKGPFQASLELQLPVGRDRRAWQPLLEQLSRRLVQQGLTPIGDSRAGDDQRRRTPAASEPAAAAPGQPSAPAPEPSTTAATVVPATVSDAGATWKRADGVVVGGWRWIRTAQADAQLLFFLGPVPAGPLLPIAGAGNPLPAPGALRLRSRPDALQSLGLLPPNVPELVRRSDQLWMVAETPSGADPQTPFSLLTGGLRVRR